MEKLPLLVYIVFYSEVFFNGGVEGGKSCTTAAGVACQFPFNYGGKSYDRCTTVGNSGVPWCATEVNTDKTYTKYGTCTLSCDGVPIWKKWMQTGPFGRGGGNPFDDCSKTDEPITSIFLREDAHIKRIQVKYGTTWMTGHGGSGGNTHYCNLVPGESIVEIKGTTGLYVDRIQFTTSTGRTCGPWGGSRGSHSFATSSPGTHVTCIKGRSGDAVDQLSFEWEEQSCQNGDGSRGDGTKQGTCPTGTFCHSDGECHKGCPSGHANFENHCYFPSFKDDNPIGPKSWSEAKDYCKKLSTQYPSYSYDLISLQNEAEYDFILNNRWSDHYETWKNTTHIWTGLNDINKDNEWKWSDGSPVEYAKPNGKPNNPPWRSGEPLDTGDEDCVLTYGSEGLQDETCSQKEAFICEGHKNVVDCVPYSEEACRDVAAKLDWTMQSGAFSTKGCYVYDKGNKYYGTVWYGTGGSKHDKKKTFNGESFHRPTGFDCNTSA